MDAVVWQPESVASNDPLPMLYAHDGPEMASYGGLLDVGAPVGAGGCRGCGWRCCRPARATSSTPPTRRTPPPSPTTSSPPCAPRARPTTGRCSPARASAAVAALHAAWTSPATFAGLLLQSGSFFTPELDPQESDFDHCDEVTGFVGEPARGRTAPDAPMVAMTCGTAEENLANNRLMHDHLRRLGST